MKNGFIESAVCRLSGGFRFIAILLLAASCTSNLYVSPRKADCVGVGPMKCYLVRTDPESNWVLHYSKIEGLKYREGLEYRLKVKKVHHRKPPADAPAITYHLVRVISVSQKSSNAFLLGSNAWALVVLRDSAGTVEIIPEYRPEITFNREEQRINGSAGCNRIFGGYEAGDEHLHFNDLGQTRMHCAESGRMELEQRLLTLLSKPLVYRMDADRLVLEEPGGGLLEFHSLF